MKKWSTGLLLYLMNAGALFAQAELHTLNETLAFSGNGWTTVKLDVANTGNKVACCYVKVGIYCGSNVNLIPSNHLFDISTAVVIAAKDTIAVDTSFNFCDTALLNYLPGNMLEGEPLYIGYSVDPHNHVNEIDESNNAGVFQQPVFFGCFTGVELLTQAAAITTIYPDPAHDWLLVESLILSHAHELILFSMEGKRMDVPVSEEGNRLLLQTGILKKGIYFLELQDKQTGERISKKFMKL